MQRRLLLSTLGFALNNITIHVATSLQLSSPLLLNNKKTATAYQHPSTSFLHSSFRINTKMHSSSLPLSRQNLEQTTHPEGQHDALTQRGLPTPLILGSGSFTRKLILKEMKVPFLLKVKSIDEKMLGDRRDGSYDGARELVLTLARAKANALIAALTQCNDDNLQHNDVNDNDGDVLDKNCMVLPTSYYNNGFVILTADQVVTHESKILEKPENIAQAKEYVNSYAISPPSTVGAVVLTHIPSGLSVEGVDTAQIRFKSSVANGDGNDLVDQMLKLNEPILSCAGGLMVEHELVKEHIAGIDGTEDSVMGLSKDLVLGLMDELGNKLREYNDLKKEI